MRNWACWRIALKACVPWSPTKFVQSRTADLVLRRSARSSIGRQAAISRAEGCGFRSSTSNDYRRRDADHTAPASLLAVVQLISVFLQKRRQPFVVVGQELIVTFKPDF